MICLHSLCPQTSSTSENFAKLEADHRQLVSAHNKLRDEKIRLDETCEVLQNRLVGLENALDSMKREMEFKSEQITRLSHNVKELRRLSQNVRVDQRTRELLDELENLRVAMGAHQAQNAFLAQTVRF